MLQALKKTWPLLPVLMLSTYPENQYAVRCIKLGAAGYLNKSAHPDDMITAVRKGVSGGIYVSAVASEALASAMGGHQGKGSSRGGTKFLSYPEHQVFRLLTAGKSVGEIGAQLELASNTVITYRLRIL